MTTPLMIFAAGFGTRMGALTQDRPKPLIPVAGRSLIDHTLDLAWAIQPEQIVVNTHYNAAMLETHLAPRGVQISRETPDILDTGGGLRAALPKLGSSPVLTSNSDAIWHGPNPFELVQDHWDAGRMEALMLCVPLERCIGREAPGDVSLTQNGQVRFGGDYVFGGVQMIQTQRVGACSDQVFSLKSVWEDMAADGTLCGLVYPGWWCDVGHPDGLAKAERLVMHGPD